MRFTIALAFIIIPLLIRITCSYQSILYIRIGVYHRSNVVYYYKQSHPIYIHTYTFHTILCLVSVVLDIRLNTLRFNFFTASGTHSFAYGSLILLQLQLHLLVLILKGQNSGSLLLRLIIFCLTLHAWIII